MVMEVNWAPELEVALFHSLHGHKPVGLNKHFHMVWIQHKLHQSSGVVLTTDQIWSHLRKLYDLDSLDEFEKFPLPSNNIEFSLSEEVFPNKDNDSSMRNQSASPSPDSSPIGKVNQKRKRN